MFSLFPVEIGSAQLLQAWAAQHEKPGLCNSENATERTHARDKISSLFHPPDHTASCHWASSPSERGHTGVFQGAVLSSAWARRNLEQLLRATSVNAGPLSSSREKQSMDPAALQGGYGQLGPFRKGPLNPNKHPLLIPYTKGYQSNERMKVALLF